ncbi:MAG: hypothetical protein J7507_11935 [Pseudoxanthomonas sp.]|nr:hypothetical protein [Pseudoxanthomonas sp.]
MTKKVKIAKAWNLLETDKGTNKLDNLLYGILDETIDFVLAEIHRDPQGLASKEVRNAAKLVREHLRELSDYYVE